MFIDTTGYTRPFPFGGAELLIMDASISPLLRTENNRCCEQTINIPLVTERGLGPFYRSLLSN
jgi:hypothetical protein